jgi:hypothetical protein
MLFDNPILKLLDKIKKSKRVRSELIRQAVTKYPDVGSSYYQSAENRMIQGLSIDIVECKMKISELTNKN